MFYRKRFRPGELLRSKLTLGSFPGLPGSPGLPCVKRERLCWDFSSNSQISADKESADTGFMGASQFPLNALKNIWWMENCAFQTGLTGGPLAPFRPGLPGAPGGPGGPGGPCAPGSPCWETLSYNLPSWCGHHHTGQGRHDKLWGHGKEAQRRTLRHEG